MRKPKPDEVSSLREAYPQGEPRIEYREMKLEREVDGEDGPISLSISSESPVLRYDWWEDERYYEVLDHSPTSVDLSYARDGLPFINSHRAYDGDQQHGIVEDIQVGRDRKLRGELRMSDAVRSQEIERDIRKGIRKKVSIGYIVGDDYEQTETKGSEIPTRRYRSWMPLEVSTVPIPADYSVGIGRAQSLSGQDAIAQFRSLHPAGAGHSTSHIEVRMSDQDKAPAKVPLSAEAERAIQEVQFKQRSEEEATRVKRIVELGAQHGVNEKVESWLRDGTPVAQVVDHINGILTERMKQPVQQSKPVALSKRDNKRFSYARLMMMQDPRLEREMQQDITVAGRQLDFGLEREVLQEAQQRHAISSALSKGGMFIPFTTADGRDLTMGERLKELQEQEQYFIRAIDSATTTTGGPFKFTQPGDFIALLRNKTSVLRAGVTILTGLTGPVSFPKQTGTNVPAWRAENPGSDVSRSDLTTSTVTLSFKTIQGAMAVSRQALFSAASGNYDLEGVIRNDLAGALGIAIDLAGLNGPGTANQPLGLLQDTNVGTAPALGTDGGTMAWGNWVDLETAVGDANADIGSMSYLTNTKQRGVAKKVAVLGNTASGVPIWTGTPGIMDGVVNGYRAIASNQVPRNLTKGTSTTVCSAVVFGVFEHLLMGVFGSGFEMMADPYTLKLQNLVDITAWSFVDFANRYPVAFSTIKDAK